SQKDNTEDNKDKWKNTAKVDVPKSPYLLRTGAVIPAILITGINSNLKGFIEAQVSENVYDTATGRFLLIPQGSRLFGAYNNGIVFGQRRVLVMWNRITFPDGKTLDIGSMSGTDFAGYSGFKDKVDNHFIRLFGSALLMSAITAGINLSQQGFLGMGSMYGYGGGRMYGMSSSSVLSQSLGQGMGEAMQQLFRRNLNIAPTLKVRPGYVLNVMVSKDLTFSKPYRNFDY
ncbi:MAG: conjugal transfer protein TrbI, partial [Acetobacter sp.]|nr:conjugal transfer protein TrbI [Acetobacter sp.]